MNKLLAMLTPIVFLASCQDNKSLSLSPITLETSQQNYTSGSTVSFTIKNDDSKPLYLSACGNNQISTEVRLTIAISSEFSNCATTGYVVVAPGSSLSDSIQLTVRPGEYVIEIMSGCQPDNLLDKILSNHFNIQ